MCCPQQAGSCNKRKKEADRLLALKEKLQEEEKRQKEHVERVLARLEQVRASQSFNRARLGEANIYVFIFMYDLYLCMPMCLNKTAVVIFVIIAIIATTGEAPLVHASRRTVPQDRHCHSLPAAVSLPAVYFHHPGRPLLC